MVCLPDAEQGRITLAILALGGQGGGVLADWIRKVATSNGYIVQTTSVPGVAQRTGSTIYYVEMLPRRRLGADLPEPILALMPVPGDVDVVLASKLMEGGRAMLRGFVTSDRTTLITSTHRVYAISEKVVAGDGTASATRIIDKASKRARRFIGFDMEAEADGCGSVISSVMLGALAGSGALPFSRESFEAAIRQEGKAVAENLRGFQAGFERATAKTAPEEPPVALATPTTEAGRELLHRINGQLPPAARRLATEGARRLMDYQDRRYAELYLDRLERIARCDGAAEGQLTAAVARWLALRMSYEDAIRVADLKIRAARSERVSAEAQMTAGQILTITDYMHPRLREICDILPARLGRAIDRSPAACRLLGPLFARGRHVESTGVFWFLALSLLAALRAFRRHSLRFVEEQDRIENWLSAVERAAREDRALAAEIAEAPRLLKGYSDTWDRSLARFDAVMAVARDAWGAPDAANRVRAAKQEALLDDSDAPCPAGPPLNFQS